MQRWYLSGERAEDYEYGIDPKLKYQGKNCIYLRPRVPEPRDFASVTQMIEATPYRNKRMRLAGALKAADIEGWAGLWMRIAVALLLSVFSLHSIAIMRSGCLTTVLNRIIAY